MMLRRPRGLVVGSFFLVVGSLAVASGCKDDDPGSGAGGLSGSSGSSGSSGTSGAPAGDAAGACDRYYDSLQKWFDRCNIGSPNSTAPDHVTHDRERFRLLCLNGLGAPGTSILPTTIEGCAKALDDRTDCYFFKEIDDDVCKFQPGALDDGAPCAEDSQCKGHHCKKGKAGANGLEPICGQCAARAAANAPCPDETACAVGTKCIDGTCKPLAGANAACSTTVFPSCEHGFNCDQVSKTCVPVKDAQAACTVTFECKPPLSCIADKCAEQFGEGADCAAEARACAPDFVCGKVTKKCTKPTFVKPGETCDNDLILCDLGSCRVTAPATTGTCPTILADGTACDATDRTKICDAYATCLDGKCTVADPKTCK